MLDVPQADHLLDQVKQTGVRGPEAASVLIKRLQMGFIVDVQPLAACGGGLIGEGLHERTSDASPLVVRVHDGVQNEGVGPAVPASVDEPDERVDVEGADPAQTVLLQPVLPGLHSAQGGAEGSSVQVRHRLVVDGEANTQVQVTIHDYSVHPLPARRRAGSKAQTLVP